MACKNNRVYEGAPSGKVPNLVGQSIDNGRLRLVARIARGAWGIVYLGEYKHEPQKYWAVKCMALDGMTESQRCSISNEVELQHICAQASPHILPIKDVLVETAVVADRKSKKQKSVRLQFIVTEYCEGGDLTSDLHREAAEELPRDDERIRSTFVQILDAVEACHKGGIYHRDLKPDNILLKDGSRKILLGDFGFATRKRLSRDFDLGSGPFMSPEVFSSTHTHPRAMEPIISSPHADIWALGVILMNLITGCMPWHKASRSDRNFGYYLNHDPNYLYNVFDISRGANEILKGVFTHDPRHRVSISELRKQVLNVKSFVRTPKPALKVTTEKTLPVHGLDSETDSDTLTSEPDLSAEIKAAMLYVTSAGRHGEADITNENVSAPTPAAPEGPDVPTSVTEEDHGAEVPIRPRVFAAPMNEADIADETFVISNGSETDDTESEGPITPETHAADNAIIATDADTAALGNVPEFDLGAASALAAIGAGVTRAKVGAKNKGKTPLPHGQLKKELAPAPPKQPTAAAVR